MTNYEIGRRFEYRVKKDLERSGFLVFRQAKSSFPDLPAIRKITGKKIVVECRVNGYFTKEEEMKLIALWVKYDIHPFIAKRKKRKIIYFDLIHGDELNAI